MPAPVDIAFHEWPPPDGVERRGTVVLVHGIMGWHRTWWRVGPTLALRGWRAVAVDQRGHGRSPRIDGRITVADWAADLARIVQRVGPPAALVGHSLGGAVSAEVAAGRPDLVRRLVLEDPPAISRTADDGWQRRQARELAAARENPDGEIRRELAENAAWDADDARQDVEGKALADGDAILASFRAGVGVRVLDLAPRITVPTLYLLGAEDRSVVPAEARARLAASLPPTSEMRVMDAGHTIHRDRFDEYVAAVAGWIER